MIFLDQLCLLLTPVQILGQGQDILLSLHQFLYYLFLTFNTALSCADGAALYCGIAGNICSGKSCTCGSTGSSCNDAILTYCRTTTATYSVNDASSTCQVSIKDSQLIGKRITLLNKGYNFRLIFCSKKITLSAAEVDLRIAVKRLMSIRLRHCVVLLVVLVEQLERVGNVQR